VRFVRLVARGDDRAVDVGRSLRRQTLAQRLAGHRHAVEMQKRLELAQERAHAARGKKILHVAVADRLEIDQHRRRVGELVELLERDLHAGPAGDRGEMDHRIGRAPQREENPQGVLDRFCVDDPLGGVLGADELHRCGAGRLGRAQAIGVRRRDRGGTGQDETQRLCEAGHRGGRAHDSAGAGGHRELAFDLRNLLAAHVAGTIARPEAAAISAGAEPLAAVTAGHHRARHQHDRRTPGGDRAHELGRHGLVAATHEHDRVHRLRANHFLGVHRHQIAVLEAGGAQEDLAQRDRGKLDRQRAGRQHPALDGVQ
jgi:hypothetical protein